VRESVHAFCGLDPNVTRTREPSVRKSIGARCGYGNEVWLLAAGGRCCSHYRPCTQSAIQLGIISLINCIGFGWCDLASGISTRIPAPTLIARYGGPILGYGIGMASAESADLFGCRETGLGTWCAERPCESLEQSESNFFLPGDGQTLSGRAGEGRGGGRQSIDWGTRYLWARRRSVLAAHGSL